jgi:hypothetical protein
MMARFCAYVEKVFGLSEFFSWLRDSRKRPVIPVASVFASAFAMFATGRTSLNSMEKDLVRIPSRLRGVVGELAPSIDSLGRIYSLMATEPLRGILRCILQRLKRNKALSDQGPLRVVAVDGHEFFSSKNRNCPDCQTRTLTVEGEEVTQYYHRGVACHLIGHHLALPLDVELLRPGEGEETAAKRLIERVVANYGRFFDVVGGDALYLDAPFINCCRKCGKHAIVVVKGDQRLLLQDAQELFSQQPPEVWQAGRGHLVQSWDEEGFTSCEGVCQPLRVLHAVETKHRRQRIAGQWQESDETSEWYWATTLNKNQMPTRELWRAGHNRWDVENDCFNTLSTHWGLDHCFKHSVTAITNFVLTLFIVYVLLQCFWQRNVKPALQKKIRSLISLAEELCRSLGSGCHAPWKGAFSRPP